MVLRRFLVVFLLVQTFCNAQTTKKEAFGLIVGYGLHGSGDLYGYQYGVQYHKDFGKKWGWTIELGGSLHDRSDDVLTFDDEEGNTYDATLHFVIGGLQTGFGMTYAPIKTENHRFGLTVMPVLRYQATSISDFIATFDPGFTNLPWPVRSLIRFEPARTLSLGAAFRAQYSYRFGNDFLLGLGISFQTDTNEDTILSGILTLGKRF